MGGRSGQAKGPGLLCLGNPPGSSRPTGGCLFVEATVLGAENSEASCVEASVTVAVIDRPSGTFAAGEKVNSCNPSTLVVKVVSPTNFLPSLVLERFA